MKQMLLIMAFSMITLFCKAPGFYEIVISMPSPINPYEKVWSAIGMYESHNNPFAINFDEGAYGIVQIRQCKLDDYNEANKTYYYLSDCLNTNVSRKIFMWHCMKYGIDIERAAKRWNGSGPFTIIYWNSILKIINQ